MLRLLILSVILATTAPAQSVTGVWTIMPQGDFNALATDGGFLHFRDRGVNEVNPFTGASSGQTARQHIAALAVTHGWPLVGMFISGSGGLNPHLVIHISEYPAQTGPQAQRADKLQTAMTNALETVYKNEQTIDDPTDPDFGQTVDLRQFFVNCHIWNYPAAAPRFAGVGDYAIYVSRDQPPGNWWQGF